MAIDLETLAAINASPLPYDLFREVHKGLRRALFGAIGLTGCTDYTDATARGAALSATGRVLGMLREHQRHEDDHIVALLARYAPVIAAILREAHAELDVARSSLEARVATIGDLRGSDAIGQGLILYRDLAAFAAVYLAHMAFEEGPAMSALRDAMNIGDLYSVEVSIRSSATPDEVCDFLTDMAPAMNVDERVTFLLAVKSSAGSEFFERARCIFQARLTADEYQQVLTRIPLSST